jgi:hypothetical protein
MQQEVGDDRPLPDKEMVLREGVEAARRALRG